MTPVNRETRLRLLAAALCLGAWLFSSLIVPAAHLVGHTNNHVHLAGGGIAFFQHRPLPAIDEVLGVVPPDVRATYRLGEQPSESSTIGPPVREIGGLAAHGDGGAMHFGLTCVDPPVSSLTQAAVDLVLLPELEPHLAAWARPFPSDVFARGPPAAALL